MPLPPAVLALKTAQGSDNLKHMRDTLAAGTKYTEQWAKRARWEAEHPPAAPPDDGEQDLGRKDPTAAEMVQMLEKEIEGLKAAIVRVEADERKKKGGLGRR